MRDSESLHDVSNLDTILTLPWQTSVMALASASRDAGLTFMNESRHWGKAELAMWLIGPYAQIVRHARVLSERTPEAGESSPDRVVEIDARFVERIMETARTEIVSTLAKDMSGEGGASFAFSMLASGYVVRCMDEGGTVGWAPSGRPRCLADRVLSLFAADYLTRPSAADGELSVCSSCGVVEVDPVGWRRGLCPRHRSVIQLPRGGRQTLPYFPEPA